MVGETDNGKVRRPQRGSRPLPLRVDIEEHADEIERFRRRIVLGPEHCVIRLEQIRAERRVDALIDSVAKETALGDLVLEPGQFVTTWNGARVGVVVKVNKVSVKVRQVGGRADRNAVVEKNLDPRYVQRAAASLPAPPGVGVEVVVRDHSGHIRRAEVVEVDGPLFEATYTLKSGQRRSGWFDLAALQPSEAGSG